ncbi:MAG: DUF1844 domain-containing protein [Candidatus Woesearchaeota archaeon]
MDEEKIHEAQFIQLVMSMQSSAWMMMGKTINPMSGTIEKNLEIARSIIDTLLMLKAKTKGNLSKTEDNFLSNTIQQLQINFIEEMNKCEKEKSKQKEEEKQKISDKTDDYETKEKQKDFEQKKLEEPSHSTQVK